MDGEDELTVAEIAELLGLNVSTPRSWVSSSRLQAHKDAADPRRWLVYRRDLDAFLGDAPRADIGRPKGRGAVQLTTREDWSDAPAEATLDLTSSVELPRGRQ
jgi:excisionase family DNA binding protein